MNKHYESVDHFYIIAGKDDINRNVYASIDYDGKVDFTYYFDNLDDIDKYSSVKEAKETLSSVKYSITRNTVLANAEGYGSEDTKQHRLIKNSFKIKEIIILMG